MSDTLLGSTSHRLESLLPTMFHEIDAHKFSAETPPANKQVASLRRRITELNILANDVAIEMLDQP